MKANQAARAGRGGHGDPDDSAVSSVVSAVLLFALLTTVVTLWTVTSLPQWIADREQIHAHGVQASFTALASGLDALSATGDTGPSMVPVALGATPVSLVQTTPSTGELAVSGVATASATFAAETLWFSDGVGVGQPDDDIDEGAGDVLGDVVALQALLLRISTTSVGTGDEAWITVLADDGTDTVTALVTHAGNPPGASVGGCSGSELRLEVTVDIGAGAPTTSAQALLCELDDDLAGYSLDLTSAFYPFLSAVERLATPFTITLTDDVAGGPGTAVAGSFAAAYTDSDGQLQAAGSGQTIDYTMSVQGKRLVYEPRYQSYAQQGVSWELGGMVVTQDDGQAVTGSSFDLSIDGSRGTIEWTFVEIAGEGSHSGEGQATVRVGHVRTEDIILSATGGSFTLNTPSAEGWRAHLASKVLLAEAGTNATVGGTGQTATFTFGSATPPAASPPITEWRIHLRIVQAQVVVL